MAEVRLVAEGIDSVVELAGVPRKGDVVQIEGAKGESELRGVGGRTWVLKRSGKGGQVLSAVELVVNLGGVRTEVAPPPVATADQDEPFAPPAVEPEVAPADESAGVDESTVLVE